MTLVFAACSAVAFVIGLSSWDLLHDPESSRPVCYTMSVGAFMFSFTSLIYGISIAL